jgi:cytochrome c2
LIQALLPAALLLFAAAPPVAAEDGRAVFEARCASCHAATAGAPPGAGPNLAGVLGRRVGGDPGFGYSPVLEEARRAGQVWDAALLERFLADPEEMFPGLWMGSNALRAGEERAAVAAFLRTTR